MKFRFLYTFSTLLFLAFLFSSNNNGRANEQGWGNTGAPGDQVLSNGSPRTCISCHGSSSSGIEVGLDIEILDGNGISIATSGYTPGETYEVKVTIPTISGSPAAVAFQMVALNAALGESGPDISDWQPISSNVQVSAASNTGRTYVEQTAPSSSNEFRMSWTAPTDLEGEVTFYSCGNGVNLNGATSGDNAACNTLVISSDQTSLASDLQKNIQQVKVFPNPVSDQVNINIFAKTSGNYSIQLLNTIGQQVYVREVNLSNGDNQQVIEMSNLSQGMYILRVSNQDQVISKNIVKTNR